MEQSVLNQTAVHILMHLATSCVNRHISRSQIVACSCQFLKICVPAVDYNTPNYRKEKIVRNWMVCSQVLGSIQAGNPRMKISYIFWVLLWFMCFGGGLGCVSYFIAPVCNVNVVWIRNVSESPGSGTQRPVLCLQRMPRESAPPLYVTCSASFAVSRRWAEPVHMQFRRQIASTGGQWVQR